VLRVTVRKGDDSVGLVESLLASSGAEVRSARASKVTVEDVFVAMVRASANGAGGPP